MPNQHASRRSRLRLVKPSTPQWIEAAARLAGRARPHPHVGAALNRKKGLNLALQGGGAHGAFTWGVIDALLEQTRIRFDGVSGTSAGAVNAVALADGLMRGGRDGARERLHEIWNDICRIGAPGSHPGSPMAYSPAAAIASTVMRRGLAHLSNAWSPYDLNPLSINPLRDILLNRIDFEKLQRESPVRLFVAATEVASGRARIFRTGDISVDAVLASACLPTLFPAIEIEGRLYWDGGFSANPDLVTLIADTKAGDTLLVQLNPDLDPEPPASNDAIAASIARLSFNQPLRGHVERLQLYRRTPVRLDRSARRLGRHRMHLIDGSPHTLRLHAETKAHPEWRLISDLRERGHETAMQWIDDELANVGKRATVDLYAKYFTERQLCD